MEAAQPAMQVGGSTASNARGSPTRRASAPPRPQAGSGPGGVGAPQALMPPVTGSRRPSVNTLDPSQNPLPIVNRPLISIPGVIDLSGNRTPEWHGTADDMRRLAGETGSSRNIGETTSSQAEKRLRTNSPDRALSPPGFRAIRDAVSGNVVQTRRISGSATTDFNLDANVANFEFRVLSNDDTARFVGECNQRGEAQRNQMEQQMEHNANRNA